MILTCPDCSTRYSVKDDAIGPNGRTVRCSSCSATWFISSDADRLALEDNLHEDIKAIVDNPPVPSAPVQSSAPSQSEANTPASTPAKPAVGAHVQVRDKADRQRRNRRLAGVTMIWMVTLSILTAAAVMGYIMRQDIVDRNPAMASLYKAFNINVKIAGLDFESPSTSHTMIDGRPVLVINGVIINKSNTPRPIPLVELSLVNGSGDVVTEWLVELEEQEIGPKQRIPYVSQYPNPPLDAVELKFKFADPATANLASIAK